MFSSTCTNAPNLRQAARPALPPPCPAGYFFSASAQGSPSACLSPREIRLSAGFTPSITTSTVSPGLQHIGRLPHLLRPRHLRQVDQSVESRLQFDERAEIGEPRNRALHPLAGVILVSRRRPGIGLQLLHAQRNPLLRRVHLQNLDLDLLADRQHVRRFIDAPARNVGHVHHAVHAADVDERAVIHQGANRARDHRAFLQIRIHFASRAFARSSSSTDAAIHHRVFLRHVQLDDAAGDLLAHQLLHLGHIARAAARSRHERAQPDVDRKTALDHRGHLARNRTAFLRTPSPAPTSPSAARS